MAYSSALYMHDLDKKAFDALNMFPQFVKLQEAYVTNVDEKIAKKLNELADRFYDSIERLEARITEANAVKEIQAQAEFFHDKVLAEMDIMRSIADEIELNMPASKWPIPAYSEIIYNV